MANIGLQLEEIKYRLLCVMFFLDIYIGVGSRILEVLINCGSKAVRDRSGTPTAVDWTAWTCEEIKGKPAK